MVNHISCGLRFHEDCVVASLAGTDTLLRSLDLYRDNQHCKSFIVCIPSAIVLANLLQAIESVKNEWRILPSCAKWHIGVLFSRDGVKR